MRFSPFSVIPEQNRSTTPDVFIVDQYGKLPALNGDGPLTINEAIRFSKIINGYAPAFTTDDNRIINGFYVINDDVTLNSAGDLTIKLPPGSGIIHKMIFKFPLFITATWPGFINEIPPRLTEGKILIYLEYQDLVQNYPNRPLPQDYPHKPTVALPEDQSSFNPIKICRAFYDSENQIVVNSEWDEELDKILIVGNLKYRQQSNGSVRVWIDERDIAPIYVNGKRYDQQGGGLYDLSEVDGGYLGKTPSSVVTPVEKDPPVGVHVLVDKIIRHPNDEIHLGANISSEFLVFFNGVLYLNGIDWDTDFSKESIYFTNSTLTPGKNIYIFENIKENDAGYLKTFYFSRIEQNLSTVKVNGLNPNKKYLVFVDGFLQSEYTIKSGAIDIHMSKGSWILIVEIIPATTTDARYVDIIYQGPAPNSALFKGYGITPGRNYLVFYNGVLYLEEVDYTVLINTISMKFPMKSTKNLTIIGV